MSINVADNFQYLGNKPLDARVKYDSVASMVAVPSANLFDGCLAYVTATKKNYQYDSTNTVDETLGRWREFSSGGGTGGGHTIEDSEGTDLTQRDTLQFGEGFLAEDDDTNKKTVISPDVMQSGDMSEVVSPLPSVQTRMPVLFDDSGTERVIGKAIINNVEKNVYKKSFISQITANSITIEIPHNISDLEYVLQLDCIRLRSDSGIFCPFSNTFVNTSGAGDTTGNLYWSVGATSIYLRQTTFYSDAGKIIASIVYTKTV